MGSSCSQEILELAQLDSGLVSRRLEKILSEVLGGPGEDGEVLVVENVGTGNGLANRIYSFYERGVLRDLLASHLESVVEETRRGPWQKDWLVSPTINWEVHDDWPSRVPEHSSLRVYWAPHPRRFGSYMVLDLYSVNVAQSEHEVFNAVRRLEDCPSHRGWVVYPVLAERCMLRPLDFVSDDGLREEYWLHEDYAAGPFVETRRSRPRKVFSSPTHFSKLFEDSTGAIPFVRDYEHREVRVFGYLEEIQDPRSLFSGRFTPLVMK